MKIATLSLALLLALLAIEDIIRLTLPIDQAPALQWDATNQLLIHRPNQTGVRYPTRDKSQPVRYTINAQGWNAPYDYSDARDYGRHLAVVVGDSFVESLQVAPAESVSARLQAQLNGWRVYGLGMSGAPMSQYLQMARYAERTWKPDIIVVIVVHNDFIESYDPPDNPLYASFWQTDGQRMIMPHAYQPRLGSHLMASNWATGRFAVQLFRQQTAQASTADFQMGVDVGKLARQMTRTRKVADYLFGQFAQMKIPLLFAMDAPRDMIEAGEDPKTSQVYALNQMAAELTAAHHLRFLDLTPVMTVIGRSTDLSFPSDYHWNAYAHDLVARMLRSHIQHLD